MGRDCFHFSLEPLVVRKVGSHSVNLSEYMLFSNHLWSGPEVGLIGGAVLEAI